MKFLDTYEPNRTQSSLVYPDGISSDISERASIYVRTTTVNN